MSDPFTQVIVVQLTCYNVSESSPRFFFFEDSYKLFY